MEQYKDWIREEFINEQGQVEIRWKPPQKDIIERIEKAIRGARIYHPDRTPAMLVYEWLEEGPDSDTWDYLRKRMLHIPAGLIDDGLRYM